MGWFKCKHPARLLFVEKEETIRPSKDHADSFDTVLYHFRCEGCKELVDLGYTRFNANSRAEMDGWDRKRDERKIKDAEWDLQKAEWALRDAKAQAASNEWGRQNPKIQAEIEARKVKK